MSVLSSYKLKFTDGEYLNYIYSSNSFLENERLDNFLISWNPSWMIPMMVLIMNCRLLERRKKMNEIKAIDIDLTEIKYAQALFEFVYSDAEYQDEWSRMAFDQSLSIAEYVNRYQKEAFVRFYNRHYVP